MVDADYIHRYMLLLARRGEKYSNSTNNTFQPDLRREDKLAPQDVQTGIIGKCNCPDKFKFATATRFTNDLRKQSFPATGFLLKTFL